MSCATRGGGKVIITTRLVQLIYSNARALSLSLFLSLFLATTKGFVVSDCDAIKTMMVRGSPGGNDNFGHAYSLTGAMAVQDGVRAGCDSNCGDPYSQFGMEAIAEGMVSGFPVQ